jgi:hypothetical protein
LLVATTSCTSTGWLSVTGQLAPERGRMRYVDLQPLADAGTDDTISQPARTGWP